MERSRFRSSPNGGARTQDVQVNTGPGGQLPLFYADRRVGALRTLAGARSRLSTRAGEWLCHYGESSGYSCAEVELTQFAPPELCRYQVGAHTPPHNSPGGAN